MWIWILGLIAILFIIAYEDIKKRLVHLVSFLLCFIFSVGTALQFKYSEEIAVHFSINLLFLLLFAIGVFIYIKAKYGLNSSIGEFIGIGDLLFLIAISPLFDYNQFLLFCIISFMASLVFHYVTLKILKNKHIPLAGYQSILLVSILPLYPFS